MYYKMFDALLQSLSPFSQLNLTSMGSQAFAEPSGEDTGEREQERERESSERRRRRVKERDELDVQSGSTRD